ncbi:Protein NIM1-INTERACTING 1 [Morella rubra]|uniref:Protein NIM1-INTERACTING 1 n=1 Tax=Morella rubra TaxID=262757 RepID=A0A6A1UQ72_9ROSI|nr:Protein NIM1-INTERACTING 1 [Morella rubra]
MEDESSLRNGEDKHEDDEEDQVKMEKFYALIRSFREARNYYKRKELNELEKKNKNKKMKRVGGDEQPSSWVPKFEREDFTEDVEFRRPPLIFPSPCNKEENKKAGEDEGDLDLKLTL